MAKLTNELRDRCAAWLRNLSPSANGGSCGHCVGTVRSLADALAACEVEAEPLKWIDAHSALEGSGWIRSADYAHKERLLYLREDGRYCFVWVGAGPSPLVMETEHCPPDLLGGRLKALEVAE